MYLEAARALAFQALEAGGNDVRQQISYAFRSCVARSPSPSELDELATFLNRQEQRFAAHEINPWEMLGTNPGFQNHLPAGASPAKAAAWTALSRVLLNLDETIT
jgi:hypothetical protein